MNAWQERFAAREMTPSRAVEAVRSGERVFVGSGCAQPCALVAALSERGPQLRDVELVHLLTFGPAQYTAEELQPSFRHNAWFIGGNVRKAVNEGRADYTPIFLSEIPELMISGQRRVDVAMVVLSPPDRHGFCSMGIHVDVQAAAIESARTVVAEVNPRMPRTLGDTLVHVDRIDAWTHSDAPLLEMEISEPDETAIRIGGHVARLIPNEACLQLGIGNIPNAILRYLSDKRDLGIHTEMFADGLIPLLENGNITNRKKKILPRKTVASFCMGSRRLYDFVDDNPSISFHPSDFVNDPRIISQNDQVVAVNSALQVDLTGQVASDSVGYRFYSGIGGQVDFIRGAAMSRGGKPIIAIPSTAKNGTVSRIVASLSEGSGVVTSRGDVHYVVTEFGVAYLHGKTIRERALALINIAHPNFREELLATMRERQYVGQDEPILKQRLDRYPHNLVHWKDFKGKRLQVRPLQASDERTLQEFFYSHRPETVYNRYFNVKTTMGHREAAELCAINYETRMALGAFEPRGRGERLLAVARYNYNPRTNFAETAVVVHEDFRRFGLATYLLQKLEEHAKERGIQGFESEILPNNRGMRELHRRLGHDVSYSEEDQVYKVRVRFQPPASERPPHRMSGSSTPALDKPA
ncbi:MAG TPA: GNAT family N-acetyltransferase [Myxococcales bacterium LLY-WYZ-16_1]|nr:GNAT family N-acetyltransferase [Myxococcales bacterium LLY-WYZ-16_1]